MDEDNDNSGSVPSFAGKNVLVTGGCGFIGSAIVEAVLDRGAGLVRVLEHDEQGVFEMRTRLADRRDRLQFFLGDLRDRERVTTATRDVDVVFHAGALKHVELGEYNPFETVTTNVEGSQNLIRAAVEAGVESFTAISTDKASHPTSVMGATKLLMERLVVGANVLASANFNCVRLGNVLGSTDSVVPIFLDQIASGGPITVTDPDMTRFVMPVGRAVDLILDAHGHMARGDVAILKMPTFRVGDLADALRRAYAPRYGYDPGDVDVEVIGKRPGERVHEKLISSDELDATHEFENMFVIVPQIDVGRGDAASEATNTLDGEFTSDDGESLSAEEIVSMIENSRVPVPTGPSPAPTGRMEVSSND